MSSQYLTALLMAAPLATGAEGITIRITDELVSQPYVDMTVRLMERFGVQVLIPRKLRTQSHLSARGGAHFMSRGQHAHTPSMVAQQHASWLRCHTCCTG